MKTSEQIDQIAKSLALAQGEMKAASKSTVNPFFKSTYSSLAQVIESIKETLPKNGISWVQDIVTTEKGVSVSTRLCHASGQWMEFGPLEIPVSKRDAQGLGSAATYGKRYSLVGACGVASEEEDDDGEAAMNRNGQDPMLKNGNKPKKEEPVTHQAICISQEQINTISSLIERCDEGYVSKLTKHLLDKGFPSYAQIPVDMYNQIITGINKNIELVEKRRKENV